MSEGTFGKPIDGQVVRFNPTQSRTLCFIQTPDNQKTYFYINPNSISFSYKPKINRRRSRAGWIDEFWGEELDTLAVDAVSGGFYSDSSGYASYTENKSTSEAFKRLEKIVKAYREAGIAFDDKNFVKDFQPVEFHFDRFIYYGFFENLTLEDTADKPFMMNFSFTFKVLGTDVSF